MAIERHELDALIDDVARQMTAGGPGASFTSDVLARLDPQERPVRSWRPLRSWRPAVAGLAAAAALLVLAVEYRRHSPMEPAAPMTVRLRSDAAGPIAAGPKEPVPQVTAQSGPKGPGLQVTAARQKRPALQIANPISSDIDALTVPSIAFEQLARVPLAPMDSLEADPLTIAPLTVTPLESGDETQRRFE